MHPMDIVLCKFGAASYPNLHSSCLDFYTYLLAFLTSFHYSVVVMIWDTLLRFEVSPHWLAPNGWRVLVSLLILTHLEDINLVLEELVFLYEFSSDDMNFTFVARDSDHFLLTTKSEEYAVG